MPIETNRTVTATTPHSPRDLLAILQAEGTTGGADDDDLDDLARHTAAHPVALDD